jgi:GDPmannose 4,6-dehydratase
LAKSIALEKDYNVIGVMRRSSTSHLQNINHILDKLTIVYGDLTDQGNLDSIITEYRPDEIYGLAAMSFVPVSWKSPAYTMEVNAVGTLRILEAIRQHSPDSRFLFCWK